MTYALSLPSWLAPLLRRLVADAQAREAPVQRLADVVAGRFCYGVMAASAATFGFWSLAGANWFPQALGELPVCVGGGSPLGRPGLGAPSTQPPLLGGPLLPRAAALPSVHPAPPARRRCGRGGRAGAAAAEPAAGH